MNGYYELSRDMVSEIINGEVIKRLYSGYCISPEGTVCCAVVITENSFCFIGYEYSFKENEINLFGIDYHPISSISGFTFSVLEKGYTGKDVYSINIRFGNAEIRLEMGLNAGSELVDEIKRFLNLNEIDKNHSLGGQLKDISELYKNGIINQKEFDLAKELFLGKPSDKKEKLLSDLNRLYGLYLSGALSQSEYNTMKWEILSRY